MKVDGKALVAQIDRALHPRRFTVRDDNRRFNGAKERARVFRQREALVRYLAKNGVTPAYQLMELFSIPHKRLVDYVLNHYWFERTPAGVHITSLGRADVLGGKTK